MPDDDKSDDSSAYARLAYPAKEAARLLGVSSTKLWQLSNLPKWNPCRIERTTYGTYPRSELERHLVAEVAARRAAQD